MRNADLEDVYLVYESERNEKKLIHNKENATFDAPKFYGTIVDARKVEQILKKWQRK